MLAHVEDHLTGRVRDFSGEPADVERRLLDAYPYLRRHYREGEGDLEGLLELLDSQQNLSAWHDSGEGVEPPAGDPGVARPEQQEVPRQHAQPRDLLLAAQLGVQVSRPLFEAAAFLAGGLASPGPQEARQALRSHPGDMEAAALSAHLLEPSGANRRALRAVLGTMGLSKAEVPDLGDGPVPAPKSVEPVLATSKEAAEAVERSFRDRLVFPVELAGKHSAGALIARDEEGGDSLLLKPGAGKNSPAAGVREEGASQTRREAAFWAVAEAWGLGGYLPRCDVVALDHREYACLALVPWEYRTMENVLEGDLGRPRAVLHRHLVDGTLHRWAALDYVLGNPDRHANNLLVGPDGEVVLIDHGSALAGVDFDPGADDDSFVPYYLRAWAGEDFDELTVAEKLRALPRTPEAARLILGEWLLALSGDSLTRVLQEYGADPRPSTGRLGRLQAAVREGADPDEAVNRAWVVGLPVS